jgi:C4-dicarboxylate-specific signal transduction histidine kinase
LAPQSLDEWCDLSADIADFVQLVGPVVQRFAEFRVDTPGEPCLVRMPRSKLVHVLSALVGDAIRAVRDRSERGLVALSVQKFGDTVAIELSNNGAAMSPATRAFALNPHATLQSGTDAGDWLRMAEQVRRAGGQLVLDPGVEGRTTVRLLLAIVPSRAAHPRPAGRSHPLAHLAEDSAQADAPSSSDAFA